MGLAGVGGSSPAFYLTINILLHNLHKLKAMNCPECKSENLRVHDRYSSKTKTRMKCKDCDHAWSVPHDEAPGVLLKTNKPAVGISLDEFRSKFDVDFIVKETVDKLDPNVIYEKNDIIKLSGLRPGYPGLSATIEAQKNYYGKIGSTLYFSHPRTIEELKSQAKLS